MLSRYAPLDASHAPLFFFAITRQPSTDEERHAHGAATRARYASLQAHALSRLMSLPRLPYAERRVDIDYAIDVIVTPMPMLPPY